MMHDYAMYNLSNDTWICNVQPIAMVIMQFTTYSNGDYAIFKQEQCGVNKMPPIEQ